MSLEQALKDAGATLGDLDGSTVARRFSTLEAEVRALREGVGISALSHLTCLRISGEGAYDALDPVIPLDMFLRSGTMRQTLLLREDGRPFADVTLCNDDDAFLILAEGATPAEIIDYLKAHFTPGSRAVIDDLGASHAMISLNGPFAWELMVDLAGPEILGFPYLSFYRPTDRWTYFRAGKTGEFGYDLLVPRAEADRVWTRLLEMGAPLDILPVGQDALGHAALENWFFDIHREGRRDLTPIELQIQWRISWGKEFVGKEALVHRREAGISQRITAIQSPEPFAEGAAVRVDGTPIGTVIAADLSRTLGETIGIGLLDIAYAHSGIDRYTVDHAGGSSAVRTVSPPFLNNRSLFVRPDRDSYRDRASIAFPSPLRNPRKPPR